MDPEVVILPEKLCNQIAAGEVVERPASVVKELVENAIDAGSTKIVIEVVNGGARLIRVSDNGKGMNQHDIFLCFERHATSKIRTEADLFNLSSLGFRGEALPAIAAVSRLRVCSRHHSTEVGMQIELKGGVVVDATEVGVPVGSMFEVQDLFYNLPARRKFLRKIATEFGRITETVMRLGLAHPRIQFQLVHNGRQVFNYYRQQQMFERIAEALGRSVAGGLQSITCESGDIFLSGYIAPPEHSRSTTQAMYTYINGRYIRDPVVKHAVLDAYRQLLMKGRYPVCVLFLHMPAAQVDVNVHPTKHEVRFHDQRLVHDFITNAVRQQLRGACDSGGPKYEVFSAAQQELATGAPSPTEHTGSIFPAEATAVAASTFASPPHPFPQSVQYPTTTEGSEYGKVAEVDDSWSIVTNGDVASNGIVGAQIQPAQHFCPSGGAATATPGYFSSLHLIGQYAHSYMVCADGDALVLIDQHAAHERIGFERLREQYARLAVERQELLFPLMLELTQSQDTQLLEQVEYFSHLGFDLEPFGGTTWALKALPVLLEEHDITTLVLDILEDLSSWGTSQSQRQAVDDVLIKMACHSMVRANERLDQSEMRALLTQLDQVDFNRHCPHGRPVLHMIPRREVEKFFSRT
ncbi:MAG: DNA mismatch repair endonuclease MutL [Desulfuromonadaceae bacterium]|nr:DNA mismatch repair endonuclease MutL [Desulfuromonas sp.]MDY0185214.1 DNA mismatch repair endonuclease MutL [Desulfuromonadaceae bacterium]